MNRGKRIMKMIYTQKLSILEKLVNRKLTQIEWTMKLRQLKGLCLFCTDGD